MTFNEVADLYLDQPTDKYAQKQGQCLYIVNLLKKEFGDRPITDFEKKLPILNYLTKLRKQPSRKNKGKLVSKAYVNSHVTYLGAVLRFARDELEIISRVPKMKLNKVSGRSLFLSPSQVLVFVRHLDELRRDMVLYSCLVGFRNMNVRKLEWTDIIEDFSAMYIAEENTKNNEKALLPINAEAQAILKRRYAKKQYLESRYPYLKGKITHVFVQESPKIKSNGKPFASSGVVCNTVWKKALKAAGLPGDTAFHTMRHTFASWHLQNGTSESELQELGTWKNAQSMKVYAHLAMKQKQKAASNISGMLG